MFCGCVRQYTGWWRNAGWVCSSDGRGIVLLHDGPCFVGEAVGTVEAAGSGCPLFTVFCFAAIQFLKVRLGDGPSFVGCDFIFPLRHFLIVEHFAGVHLLHVYLYFLVVVGWHADVPAKFLVFIELACIFCYVRCAVPFDLELFGGLFLFKRRYGAPCCFEVREDGFYRLIRVSDVVLLQFLDVRCVDDLRDDAVDDDTVDRFLRPKLCFVAIVCARDDVAGADSHVVGETGWNERRPG